MGLVRAPDTFGKDLVVSQNQGFVDLEHISVENALFSRGKITQPLHQGHKEEEKNAGFEPLTPELKRKKKRRRKRRWGGAMVDLVAGLLLGCRDVL